MQAVDKLFKGKFFSICAIDSVVELTGASKRSDAYQLLRALHCQDYADMAPELRERLPHLVREAITPAPSISGATAVATQGLIF